MQIYEVRISHGARADMAELRKFLKSMMTVEGAIRYANNMREEIKTLAFYMTRTCPLSLPCHCDTLSLRYETPFKRNHLSHQTSSIIHFTDECRGGFHQGGTGCWAI